MEQWSKNSIRTKFTRKGRHTKEPRTFESLVSWFPGPLVVQCLLIIRYVVSSLFFSLSLILSNSLLLFPLFASFEFPSTTKVAIHWTWKDKSCPWTHYILHECTYVPGFTQRGREREKERKREREKERKREDIVTLSHPQKLLKSSSKAQWASKAQYCSTSSEWQQGGKRKSPFNVSHGSLNSDSRRVSIDSTTVKYPSQVSRVNRVQLSWVVCVCPLAGKWTQETSSLFSLFQKDTS